MMLVCSFSSSCLAHTPNFLLHSNPTPIRKIKNQKIFVGFSSLHQTRILNHHFIDSPSRAAVKCLEDNQQQLVQDVDGEEEQVRELERLFSNLNQATLKREPGTTPKIYYCFYSWPLLGALGLFIVCNDKIWVWWSKLIFNESEGGKVEFT